MTLLGSRIGLCGIALLGEDYRPGKISKLAL
jgi:hypothetical protein